MSTSSSPYSADKKYTMPKTYKYGRLSVTVAGITKYIAIELLSG